MAEYLSDKEQEEQLKGLIKKHGMNVLIAILLGLSVFFGYQYWQNKQVAKLANANITYDALEKQSLNLGDQSKAEDSQAFLASVKSLVESAPNSVFALKALFLQAKHLVSVGNLEEAAKTLKQAASLDAGDDGLKTIAHLRLAQVQLASGKADDALATLSGVTLKSFEPSKQELLGDVYVSQNKPEDAKAAYQKAWDLLSERKEPRVGLKLKMESLGLKPEVIETPQIINEQATRAAQAQATIADAVAGSRMAADEAAAQDFSKSK